ncbi:MAG: hypothetical protein HC875_34705 [Anaerolineales bacterium]|nr:hypothetical protein [Anaerolineales bacterium]
MSDEAHNPADPAEEKGTGVVSNEPVSPEAKAKAGPAKKAVKQAVRQITTPEEAQQVADTMLDAAAGLLLTPSRPLPSGGSRAVIPFCRATRRRRLPGPGC